MIGLVERVWRKCVSNRGCELEEMSIVRTLGVLIVGLYSLLSP